MGDGIFTRDPEGMRVCAGLSTGGTRDTRREGRGGEGG